MKRATLMLEDTFLLRVFETALKIPWALSVADHVSAVVA